MASGWVTATVTSATGRVQVWLRHPKKGYVFAEASPGNPATVKGRMINFQNTEGYCSIGFYAPDYYAKDVEYHFE